MSKVYAVDFDGTLCEDKWPKIGTANDKLIGYLIGRRQQGEKVILWTCRSGELLQKAVEWCREHGLEFDAETKTFRKELNFSEGTAGR